MIFIISLIFLGIFILFVDKVVLVLIQARYLSTNNNIVNQMSNFAFHTNTKKVKIYTSSKFSNNIYFTKTVFGNSVIIIGDKLLKELSVNEIKVLIYASLICVKNKNFFLLNLMVFWGAILYPIFYLKEFIKSEKINFLLSYILFPFYIFRKISSNENKMHELDREIILLEGLKNEYLTAIFKISKLKIKNEMTFSGFVLNDLVLVSNISENVILNFFNRKISIESRVKQLL